jgi:hypothetical protein
MKSRNSRNPRNLRSHRAVAAFATMAGLAFAAAAAAGDPVYKSTMPDGRVVYGESPIQGARRVDKVATPPEHAGIMTATAEDKARAAQIESPRAGVTVIPQPNRPPVRGATQGYSANPNQALTGRRY